MIFQRNADELRGRLHFCGHALIVRAGTRISARVIVHEYHTHGPCTERGNHELPHRDDGSIHRAAAQKLITDKAQFGVEKGRMQLFLLEVSERPI